MLEPLYTEGLKKPKWRPFSLLSINVRKKFCIINPHCDRLFAEYDCDSEVVSVIRTCNVRQLTREVGQRESLIFQKDPRKDDRVHEGKTFQVGKLCCVVV